MYIPPHFDESRIEVLHELVRRYPLGTLVTVGTDGGLVANHIPFLLGETPGPFGLLQGHVARANPVWSESRTDGETLVVFQGPDAYISPSWYPTKQESGRVVPTWNYVAVHAYGRLRVIDDTGWVRSLVERLTATHEAAFPRPWAVSDAPADYLASRLRAIVGIEVVLTRLVGKWKVSQNQPEANRAGVVEGLESRGTPDAAAVADLVRRAKKGS